MFTATIKAIRHTPSACDVDLSIEAPGIEPESRTITAHAMTPATFEAAVKTELSGLNTNFELVSWLNANKGKPITA